MEQFKIHGENQQENLLWWLGGIIDGEGCITINHHRLHKGKIRETLLFSPVIIITNTNKKIIDVCIEIMQNNGIPYYLIYSASNPVKNCQAKWIIRIQGIKRCIRALNIISKYLIGKKEESDLVKRFCEGRLRKNIDCNSLKGRMRDGRKWGGNSAYNDEDFEIIMNVAKIHNRNPQRLYAEICNYKERIAKQDKVRPMVKSID